MMYPALILFIRKIKYMLEPWRTGKVIKIENATALTRRFWIQVPELEAFDFKAGQFVTLELHIHEQKNKRPFSDAYAQRVIAGQAREIDRLHAIIAELRRETSK